MTGMMAAMSRFSQPQDPVFQQLNASIGFDRRLGSYDVAQSRAHARMLKRAGILDADELDRLLGGLDAVAAELGEERFPFRPDDEDIHMAVERRVTELAGPVGGKLHTARSRNDQVATDVIMFTRDHAGRVLRALRELRSVLLEAAERHRENPMPGYTHLQRAQPVYLGHHLLAYFWMFGRDERRFAFVLEATSELPLGAGALAGVNFDTDRRFVAEQLGFDGVAANSIDAVSNRDFVLTSWPPPRRAPPTCRAWERRSCCGRARSSASARSPTRGRRAPRSCRRRRTPTPPSCCAARRRASPPISPPSRASCTDCR
jgi:argininosuccinate lyase